MTAVNELPPASAAETGPAIAARSLDIGVGAIPFVRGEIVALLGANGAGKTTTLMGLAGVITPAAGHVEFRGAKATGALHTRARRGLALLTQERCVFMGLSVREHIRVGGCDPEVALETFPELKPHLNGTVGLLSGGQQQMLAVARAIVPP